MSTLSPAREAPAARALPALRDWIMRHRELIWVVSLLLLAAVIHGVNMFSFPYYESDEGTYMSQAYAVANLGTLAPYTYWYDHAPAGWMLIAAWAALSGGFHTFGGSVNSGRALMLLLQVGSALMVYQITRATLPLVAKARTPQAERLWAGPAIIAASIATLSFICSAYGIYYHRRVLLDNITTFWMLLSLMMLITGRFSLTRVWVSAAALGLSILSKELTVFLVPVILCLVWHRSHPSHRWLAMSGWVMIMGSIVSLYVLMATLKGELFPVGTWLGGTHAHVSLIETLTYQTGRGKDGGLFTADSYFWVSVSTWAKNEPLLVLAGTAGMVASILMLPWHRTMGLLGLTTLMLWLFLGRGGVTFDFYLVPLLPMLAINFGLLTGLAAGWLRAGLLRLAGAGPELARPRRGWAWLPPLWLALPLVVATGSVLLSVRSFLGPSYGMLENSLALWATPQADVQHLAVTWIEQNIPPASRLVIDQSMWLDLHDTTGSTQPFPNAHYYWKVDKDPEIFNGVFAGNRDSADYIITTPQLRKDVRGDVLPLVSEILVHSTLVKHFDTGGWPVEVRKVHQLYPGHTTSDVLGRTWETYKARFIRAGRVIDPGRSGDTTSEGQSYAMLRAVYMNDRPTFDAVWGWTKANLQRPEGTFAWRYGERAGGAAQVIDHTTATDGDQDAALALLLASRRWSEPAYQREALPILSGIWDHETAFVGGQSVLVAGDWARGDNGKPPVVNPSYFAPYAYRIFQQADPSRPWITLVASSYAILDSFAQDDQLGARSGMLPTWVALDPQTGTPSIAKGMQDADTFGYDGLRAPWRISLDWLWYRDARAQQALLRFRSLGETLKRDGKIVAAYATDGTPRAADESIAMYAGVVPAMLFAGSPEAWSAFDMGIQRRYVDDGHTAYWGDPNNYYDQNWAWFSTALLDGALGNLWEGHERFDWSALIIN